MSDQAAGGEKASATDMALIGASRAKSDAFLDDQRHHLHEQARHLREQLGLKLWELRMGVFLRLATLLVGIGVAAGAGLIVWQAAHSKGLIVEPFAVPPDMAAKGLSGEVVAGQILDKLTKMQSVTTSSRPPQSYARNWGEDVKVEIPETGISVSEFQRFLRAWLGHDTRISGEVWHTPTGLAIAVRTAGVGSEPVTGSESDFDGLMEKAAEQVYGATQPYRYANFLDRNIYHPGTPLRIAEAEAIYRRLIYDPDPLERGWAWNGLGTLAYSVRGNNREAVRLYHKALEARPDLPIAYSALISMEDGLGHAEASLAAAQNFTRVSPGNGLAPAAALLGDFAAQAAICKRAAEAALAYREVSTRDQNQECVVRALGRLHDGAAVREWITTAPAPETAGGVARRPYAIFRAKAALEDWKAVAATEAAMEETHIKGQPGFDHGTAINRTMRPLLALAKANLGDFAGAKALAAAMPGDCYDCMRVRGTVASLAGEGQRADYWFARATNFAPSIPFAPTDWGRSLLARGKADVAIEMFKLANQRGPKFADPLAYWGEALMARNQSHKALAKFAAAEKFAPNWGRLHLKWGEALVYAGKPEEARKQFARAAALDLTSSERAGLVRVN